MAEVTLEIGGRNFIVACQDGEEASLKQAASLLDVEATILQDQIGRVPETRMLLMAGLMLADRAAELAEKAARSEEDLDRLSQHVHKVESRATELAQEARSAKGVEPEKYEAALAALARAVDRAEALGGS